MHNQNPDPGNLFVKLIIFCVSGLLIIPFTLQDCAPAYQSSDFYEYVPPLPPAPKRTNMVGMWTLDNASETYLNQVVSDAYGERIYLPQFPYIEFYSDNTFKIFDLPKMRVENLSESPYISHEGTWNVYLENDIWKLLVSYNGQKVKADLYGGDVLDILYLSIKVNEQRIKEPLVFNRTGELSKEVKQGAH